MQSGRRTMSLDRSYRYGDELGDGRAGPARRGESQPGRVPDIANDGGPADATRAERAPLRLPTKEERIAAYWQNRLNADAAQAAYAAGRRDPADRTGTAADSQDRDTDTRQPLDPPQPPVSSDNPSPNEGASLKRVTELEADKEAQARLSTAQDAKIAEQGAEIAELRAERTANRAEVSELRAEIAAYRVELAEQRGEIAEQRKLIAEQGRGITELRERFDRSDAYADQMTTAIGELRQSQDEPHPSGDLARRAKGGEAERTESKEPEHHRHLPTDIVNNIISITAGAAVSELGVHIHSLPPDVAVLGSYAASLGAGIIAVLRERREAKNNADHRPEG
jgi:hypothetical protein